jgi:hypothetical protein
MTRYDELGLRERLRDAVLLADRIALSVAAGDPAPAREYADWTSPSIAASACRSTISSTCCEGLRAALPSVVDGDAMGHAEAAIDEAVARLPLASTACGRRPQAQRVPAVHLQGRLT